MLYTCNQHDAVNQPHFHSEKQRDSKAMKQASEDKSGREGLPPANTFSPAVKTEAPAGGGLLPCPRHTHTHVTQLLDTPSSKQSPAGNLITHASPLRDPRMTRGRWTPGSHMAVRNGSGLVGPVGHQTTGGGRQPRVHRLGPLLRVGGQAWETRAGSPGLTPRAQRLSKAKGRAGQGRALPPTQEGPHGAAAATP